MRRLDATAKTLAVNLIVIAACVGLWIAPKPAPPTAVYSCQGNFCETAGTPPPVASQGKLPDCPPLQPPPPPPACQPGGSGRCRFEYGPILAGPPCNMPDPPRTPLLLQRLPPLPPPLPWWRKAPRLRRLPFVPTWLPRYAPPEPFQVIVSNTTVLPPPLIARPPEDLPPCRRGAVAPPGGCRI